MRVYYGGICPLCTLNKHGQIFSITVFKLQNEGWIFINTQVSLDIRINWIFFVFKNVLVILVLVSLEGYLEGQQQQPKTVAKNRFWPNPFMSTPHFGFLVSINHKK